jgi:hypothetical protein
VEDKIRERIAALRKELETYIAEVNKNIFATNTVIAELEALLAGPEPAPAEDPA